jgi:acetyl-CoA synthetase (ADP-forming)
MATGRSTRTLSEFESKQKIAAAGVPIAPERLVRDGEAAAAAAEELGFPVAVKLCGAAIAHKTERNLLRLGVRDAGGARAAATELLAAARPEDGEVALLVSRMVSGKRELIAGMIDDPTFGRAVMLGIGGIFAEALGDVVFRLAPLTRVDAEEMLDDLAHQKLLGAFRGEPAVDRAKLVDVLVGLGDLAVRDTSIVSIDVNPLIVENGVPIAVDALVEVAA